MSLEAELRQLKQRKKLDFSNTPEVSTAGWAAMVKASLGPARSVASSVLSDPKTQSYGELTKR